MAFSGTFKVPNSPLMRGIDTITITANGASFSLNPADYTINLVPVAAVVAVANGVQITLGVTLIPGEVLFVQAGITGGSGFHVTSSKGAV